MGSTVTKRSLAEMCGEFLATREQAKQLYKEADEILADIAEELEPGDMVKFKDAAGVRRAYVLLDNFEGVSERWGHACVRRYDIEQILVE